MPKNWLSVMQSPYRDRPPLLPSRLRGAHRGVEVWPDEGFSKTEMELSRVVQEHASLVGGDFVAGY